MMTANPTNLIPYSRVAMYFDAAGALFSPSEAHGILCGLICAGKQSTGVSYLDLIVGSDTQENLEDWQRCRDVVIQLYKESSEQLSEMSFEFSLLLPEDNCHLKDRACALSEWCNGFMTGLRLAKLEVHDGCSEDSRNALNHFVEIGKLDYDSIAVNEEDEKSYMEVMEYARMAVLMIYAEFANKQKTSKAKIIIESDNNQIH